MYLVSYLCFSRDPYFIDSGPSSSIVAVLLWLVLLVSIRLGWLFWCLERRWLRLLGLVGWVTLYLWWLGRIEACVTSLDTVADVYAAVFSIFGHCCGTRPSQ